MKPKKFAVALCGQDTLGLITCDKPKEVTYPDGTKGQAWVGFHLTDKTTTIGNPWSSRNPKVLGYLDIKTDDCVFHRNKFTFESTQKK